MKQINLIKTHPQLFHMKQIISINTLSAVSCETQQTNHIPRFCFTWNTPNQPSAYVFVSRGTIIVYLFYIY